MKEAVAVVQLMDSETKLALFIGARILETYYKKEGEEKVLDHCLLDFGTKSSNGDDSKYIFTNDRYVASTETKFSSSWDWLMLVWFKFRDLTVEDKYKFSHDGLVEDIAHAIDHAETKEGIKKVFELLVEAIDWYNTLPK